MSASVITCDLNPPPEKYCRLWKYVLNNKFKKLDSDRPSLVPPMVPIH